MRQGHARSLQSNAGCAGKSCEHGGMKVLNEDWLSLVFVSSFADAGDSTGEVMKQEVTPSF